jgi:hypothetical protein
MKIETNRILTAFASLGLAFFPGTSFGHAPCKIGATTPPRTNDMGLKNNANNNGCGDPNLIRGSNVTTLVAGQTLKLQWTEYIYHRGHYRIALSPSGQVGAEFDDPKNVWLMMDNSDDTAMPKEFEASITVPNTPCSNCTLQFTQFMSDTGTNYYSCSDIVILPASTSPTPVPAPTVPPAKSGDCDK